VGGPCFGGGARSRRDSSDSSSSSSSSGRLLKYRVERRCTTECLSSCPRTATQIGAASGRTRCFLLLLRMPLCGGGRRDTDGDGRLSLCCGRGRVHLVYRSYRGGGWCCRTAWGARKGLDLFFFFFFTPSSIRCRVFDCRGSFHLPLPPRFPGLLILSVFFSPSFNLGQCGLAQ
jgi:hypothetical protein